MLGSPRERNSPPLTSSYLLLPISLDIPRAPRYTPARMENQTTNIDLSALDTEAMRSRLSELGSYL